MATVSCTVGYWRKAKDCQAFVDWLSHDIRARIVSVDVHGDGFVRFEVDVSAFDEEASI